jgi:hypothetical protein
LRRRILALGATRAFNALGTEILDWRISDECGITEAFGMTALSALCAATWVTGVIAQEKPSGKELPQRSEISGITPEVLVRTDVPGAPGKIEIVTRTT